MKLNSDPHNVPGRVSKADPAVQENVEHVQFGVLGTLESSVLNVDRRSVVLLGEADTSLFSRYFLLGCGHTRGERSPHVSTPAAAVPPSVPYPIRTTPLSSFTSHFG